MYIHVQCTYCIHYYDVCRILVTRGLCSALKERVEYADATLGQGRADHKDNVDLDRLRLEQYRVRLAAQYSDPVYCILLPRHSLPTTVHCAIAMPGSRRQV